jgi:agmatinase
MKNDNNESFQAGIQTFMRSSHIGLSELEGYDVGVIGVPLDYGASYRHGAKHAPRRIREYSHWDRVDGSTYIDLETGLTLETNNLKIADLGDIDIDPCDAEKNNSTISEIIKKIRKQAFPIIIGGDHSITYAAARGCLQALASHQTPMGILHFDAHPDIEMSYGTMPRVWHGNVFRTLIDEGHLKGENMVTIGPRGLLPKNWADYIREQKINLHSMPDIKKEGLDATIENAIKYLRERCASVYITFDIDAIDPADAPGTGTPLNGGLRANEIIPALRKLNKLPVVGFDLTEVNPPLDPSGRTNIVACDLLWNVLSFVVKPK